MSAAEGPVLAIRAGMDDAALDELFLHLHEYFTRDNGFVAIFYIILRYNAVVLYSSLCEEVRGIGFLQQGISNILFISQNLIDIAGMPFSISSEFWMLCLWAVPYGLGAGAVDTALNNFVALHYASRHMSWLHCFWGLGASIGPYIMGYSLTTRKSWEGGYVIVGVFQVILTAVLFFSLPIWNKQAQVKSERNSVAHKHLSIREALRIKGVKQVLLGFFAYCGLETTTGLWASSFLVLDRGFGVEAAARWASLFYLGITIGRFLNGFVADRAGNRTMIRIGLSIISLGLLAMILPLQSSGLTLAGLILIGLGCAPIYPCIIHETPRNFGAENSQAIIGIQMASAYTGSTFMPPVFGFLADHLSIGLYPFYLILFLIMMVVMTEWLNRVVVRKKGEFSASL